MVNTLHLSGTSYEIGQKHGILAKSQIHACLTNYAAYFANAGMSPGDVKLFAQSFSTSIQKYAPHLHDELRGIADGADVPLYDIVALNARSEIALAARPKKAGHVQREDDDEEEDLAVPADGCTTFAETTTSGTQWLAQNWDWQTSQLSNLVLLEIELPASTYPPTSVTHIKTMTEAGLLAKVGFNSAQTGVCLNALRATDLDKTKLPLHVLLRLVLESGSVADARERVQKHFGGGAACYGHFGIADGSGHAESWEIGPYGIGIIERDAEGRLYHTNHALKPHLKINEVIWLEDTKDRLARIKHLVEKSNKKFDHAVSADQLKERIFSFLRDEDNYPNSICRSNDTSQPGLLGEMQTVFSMVMDLSESKAWVSVGRPKQVLEEFALVF
ncbi:acyl-coenzyme A:6-aminopenicillanic acid acyl-transferase-domain-containing protein [Lipomyces arxii]|uniref:acyl-coenzyme A:6-aminopenicillanic acid acyl-transferase-domain-containing protein n=1 Tax=Lipomyces arxii TaxID=56418 RepID=UPI0034CD0737